MITSHTPASREVQGDSLPPSADDQQTHMSEAQAIHDGMSSRVGSVIESTSPLETPPYFKIAGYYLSRHNHGAPSCPDIAIGEQDASRTKPQAWSKNIDGQEHWFYNYPGACAEAKHLGKAIPTIDQWMEMFASIEGGAAQKANTLSIPMAGYRDAANGEFYSAGDYAYFWSSSPIGNVSAYWTVLARGDADAGRYWDGRVRGVSLRFLADTE